MVDTLLIRQAGRGEMEGATMPGFAVAQAHQELFADKVAANCFAAAPTSFETVMRALEPFAWPIAAIVVALAIVAAAGLLRPRRA